VCVCLCVFVCVCVCVCVCECMCVGVWVCVWVWVGVGGCEREELRCVCGPWYTYGTCCSDDGHQTKAEVYG